MHAAHMLVLDIGSTVVKFARLDAAGAILRQDFHPRDFELGIAGQVEALLAAAGADAHSATVRACSSANGGLRVGIVSLSEYFSGAAVRNQALSAGANPLYLDTFDTARGQSCHVDALLLTGGIDCTDAGPLRERLAAFDPSPYTYGSMVYCGNRHLADAVRERFGDVVVVANPLADGLVPGSSSVFDVLRHAYLDDLVYKEGISELGGELANGVQPTPEVVSRGFRRALSNKAGGLRLSGPCILADIGGATTDLHYTVELVRDDSRNRPAPGASVARYVFTDLGVAFSYDSTLLRLRNHPRLFDFLVALALDDVRGTYRAVRECLYEPDQPFLAMACLFLALDRFYQGRDPGLPTADPNKVTQLVLTGGAAQCLDEARVREVAALFSSALAAVADVLIDRDYSVWVEGIRFDE